MPPKRRSRAPAGNITKSTVMTRAGKKRKTNDEFKKLREIVKHPPKNKVMEDSFKSLGSRLRVVQKRYQNTISFLLKYSNPNVVLDESLNDSVYESNYSSSKSEFGSETNQSIQKESNNVVATQQSFSIFLGDYGLEVPEENHYKLDVIFDQPDEAYFCCKCFTCFETSSSLAVHYKNCRNNVTLNNAHCIYSECYTDVEVYLICGSYFNDFVVNLMKFCCLYGQFLYEGLESLDFFLLFQKSTRKLIGFFSRDKAKEFVFCVLMVLPPYQKMGYGYFLVELAYDIAKDQNITSAPERPYSPAGGKTIMKYWRYAIGKFLKKEFDEKSNNELTLQAIREYTHIPEDNISDVLMRKEVCIENPILCTPKTRYKFQTFISDADAIERKTRVRFYPTCVYKEALTAFSLSAGEPDQMHVGFTGRKF